MYTYTHLIVNIKMQYTLVSKIIYMHIYVFGCSHAQQRIWQQIYQMVMYSWSKIIDAFYFYSCVSVF